jgi:hypothetical protein
MSKGKCRMEEKKMMFPNREARRGRNKRYFGGIRHTRKG